MGRKHVVKTFKMVTDGDMSGAITSNATNVLQLDQASIYLEWTGTSVDGEFTVEARNGENAAWYTLDFNTDILAENDTDYHQIVFREMPFTDMRLVYTPAAGTGTLNATLTMKTVGA